MSDDPFRSIAIRCANNPPPRRGERPGKGGSSNAKGRVCRPLPKGTAETWASLRKSFCKSSEREYHQPTEIRANPEFSILQTVYEYVEAGKVADPPLYSAYCSDCYIATDVGSIVVEQIPPLLSYRKITEGTPLQWRIPQLSGCTSMTWFIPGPAPH